MRDEEEDCAWSYSCVYLSFYGLLSFEDWEEEEEEENLVRGESCLGFGMMWYANVVKMDKYGTDTVVFLSYL